MERRKEGKMQKETEGETNFAPAGLPPDGCDSWA